MRTLADASLALQASAPANNKAARNRNCGIPLPPTRQPLDAASIIPARANNMASVIDPGKPPFRAEFKENNQMGGPIGATTRSLIVTLGALIWIAPTPEIVIRPLASFTLLP